MAGLPMVFPSNLPKGPCYAVIFTSVRGSAPEDRYDTTAMRMLELAQQQPGYLGVESLSSSTANPDDALQAGEAPSRVTVKGITVSYWKDEESIKSWRRQTEHLAAQKQAKNWYTRYEIRICKIERSYGFGRKTDDVDEG